MNLRRYLIKIIFFVASSKCKLIKNKVNTESSFFEIFMVFLKGPVKFIKKRLTRFSVIWQMSSGHCITWQAFPKLIFWSFFYSVCLNLQLSCLFKRRAYSYYNNYYLPAATYISNLMLRSCLSMASRTFLNVSLSKSLSKTFSSLKTISTSSPVSNSANWYSAKK